jgi:hypothetical protein
MAGEERDDVLPESNLEVIVRSPEIQDAEPIRSAPMSGAAMSSRGGIELLAPGRAVDEGKLSVPLSSRSAIDAEYPSDSCYLLQDVVKRSRQKI